MFVRTAINASRAIRRPINITTTPIRLASTTTSGPFGNNTKESMIWFAKATAACGVLGYTLANVVLTDENVHKASRFVEEKAKEMGLDIKIPSLGLDAHAFTLVDDGQHAPHYPWAHHSWFKTYDHAA
jgi:hypothetical protein